MAKPNDQTRKELAEPVITIIRKGSGANMNNDYFRPMLATDVILEKIKYPVIVMPKLDGIHALIKNGHIYGRSLKLIPNDYTRSIFSTGLLDGLNGELIIGNPADPNCIQKTTSGIVSKAGEPEVHLHCFDDFTDPRDSYKYRLKRVEHRIKNILSSLISCIPYFYCANEQEILDIETKILAMGFEGLIIRDPNASYKYGRSTQSEGGFLRLKRFTDTEGLVISITAGQTNNNTKEINELGKTKRSTRKENMIQADRVGTITVLNLVTSEVHDVSPGKMTRLETEHYYQHQDQIIGKIIKYKYFAIGVKDKPRFPTFQCFRSPIDL
jgi:DNA ligase-1